MNNNPQKNAATEPMFSAIAGRYDLCNHVFSFGLDFYWRWRMARSGTDKITDALDLCCGTGDAAFALARTGKVKHIIGCDISRPMLELALKKQPAKHCTQTDFNWLLATADQTGLKNQYVDLVTCAFGLRNVDNLPKVLQEAYRVIRPGGKVVILEFNLPPNAVLRKMYQFYLCRIMPRLGRWIAGDGGPWTYLAESIHRWEKISLSELLRQAGFKDVVVQNLTFGAVQIYTAEKYA